MRRLFFALWPDAPIRAEIMSRRTLLGALSPRRVPDHNLHLTLVFLGNQPEDRVDDIAQIADDSAPLSGELRLDHFGDFREARVAWLGGAAPASMAAWVQSLADRLARAGLSFPRRAFRPHVTLFRRVKTPRSWPDCPPLTWPWREFALIESIPSRPYQVLRTWSV